MTVAGSAVPGFRRIEVEGGGRHHVCQRHQGGWAEGVHADDLERCVAIYRDHFGRREAFEMEYRLRRADGAYRWIFDRGVLFEVDGHFAGVIGSCVDVDDRVGAQADLDQRRLERIEQLENLLPQCMYCRRVRDGDGAWEDVAVYLRQKASTAISHGICPDCRPRMLEDLGCG